MGVVVKLNTFVKTLAMSGVTQGYHKCSLPYGFLSFLSPHSSHAVVIIDSLLHDLRMFILKSTYTHRVPSVGIIHTP